MKTRQDFILFVGAIFILFNAFNSYKQSEGNDIKDRN